MTKPVRIQIQRRKGWRMPPNTVKVDRSTKWGNQYTVGCGRTASYAVTLFRREIEVFGTVSGLPIQVAKDELRGKNLACWCKVGAPCHGDVLLELANQQEVTR